jgi:hypothetical protein
MYSRAQPKAILSGLAAAAHAAIAEGKSFSCGDHRLSVKGRAAHASGRRKLKIPVDGGAHEVSFLSRADGVVTKMHSAARHNGGGQKLRTPGRLFALSGISGIFTPLPAMWHSACTLKST